MSDQPADTDDEQPQAAEFHEQADQAPPGLMAEFVYFLLHNKKWWLAPIILALLLLGLLAILGGSGVLPFIYPL